MKVLSTYKVSYVIPETPEERAEIEKIIDGVKKEKLGVDFQLDDLKPVDPKKLFSKGFWRREES